MGTRADFYIGRSEVAEWLGSIAWDGYPSGISDAALSASNETDYRAALAAFFSQRDDVTLPSNGWPWPWETSHTTDYAYALDAGKVWAACFGQSWFDPQAEQPNEDSVVKVCVFPNMKALQNVTFGPRSGVLIIQASR